jgi:hypothetical protein
VCSPRHFNGYFPSARFGHTTPSAGKRAGDTVSYVKHGGAAASMRAPTAPKLLMTNRDSAVAAPSAPASIAALAEQLRDGPLQRLVELQMQTTALANRLADGAPAKIEDVEQLVRLSISAMQHFNAFTVEFAAVLRDLTDDRRHPH